MKDSLTEYAHSFPPISIVLEVNVDRCIYGQRGFENNTFGEMWELYSQYLSQKNRPEQYSTEQRENIQRAQFCEEVVAHASDPHHKCADEAVQEVHH